MRWPRHVKTANQPRLNGKFKGCAFINAAIQLPNQLHPAYLAVLNHKQRTREWLLSLALAEGFDGPAARRLSSYLMILMEGAIITALVQNDLDAGRRAGEAAAILIDRYQSQHRDAV